MIETVNQVLDNLDQEFPDLSTSDYELSGFAWFQGWNDGASQSFLDEYEINLHNLIRDVRSDLGKDNLPFVVSQFRSWWI